MNTSPIPILSAPALTAQVLPDDIPILDPLLASNGSGLVYGPPGVGKTFLALGIAWAAASGGAFLGWRARRPHRVFFADGEAGAAAIRQRLALFGESPLTLELALPDLGDGPAIDLASPEGQYRLMESWGDPELVVLHTVSSLAPLRYTDSEAAHNFHRFLLHQRRAGRAVLLVDEATRKGPLRAIMRDRNPFDFVIALRQPRGWRPADGARFEIHFEKVQRLAGGSPEPLVAELGGLNADGTAGWSWGSVAQDEVERAARLLKGGYTVEAMGNALGVAVASAYRLQRRARERGLIPPRSERARR